METIPVGNPFIGHEEADAVAAVVRGGWVSMGKKVKEFEERIQGYLGVKHAILFNNGTSSLHAALVAMGVGPGDEVIVPTLTYISCANAVVFCGATPVFCEVDPKTYNVTKELIEPKITKKTKVIMTVDLKGMSPDFDEILELSKRYGIPILSDSAESFGGKYKDKMIGGQCPAHSFSFFANKNITMGEGGLVTTNDEDIAKVCRIFRNQGQSERYHHVMVGQNYRPTDFAAALGMAQLDRLEWIMAEKEKVASYYNKALANEKLISIPFLPSYVSRHSWYLYCVNLAESVDRNQVISLMAQAGVETRLSFPPIHMQPAYRNLYGFKGGEFPISEKIFKHFLDIPSWANMGVDRMQRVVDVLKSSVQKSIIN